MPLRRRDEQSRWLAPAGIRASVKKDSVGSESVPQNAQLSTNLQSGTLDVPEEVQIAQSGWSNA